MKHFNVSGKATHLKHLVLSGLGVLTTFVSVFEDSLGDLDGAVLNLLERWIQAALIQV